MLKRITSKLALCCSLLLISMSSYAEQFNVLLFTMTQGYHHESQLEGVAAMRELAKKHFFKVDWQEDPAVFKDENLNKYQAIVDRKSVV